MITAKLTKPLTLPQTRVTLPAGATVWVTPRDHPVSMGTPLYFLSDFARIPSLLDGDQARAYGEMLGNGVAVFADDVQIVA